MVVFSFPHWPIDVILTPLAALTIQPAATLAKYCPDTGKACRIGFNGNGTEQNLGPSTCGEDLSGFRARGNGGVIYKCNREVAGKGVGQQKEEQAKRARQKKQKPTTTIANEKEEDGVVEEEEEEGLSYNKK